MAQKLIAFTLFVMTVSVHYFTPEETDRGPASETTIGTAGEFTASAPADMTVVIDRNPKVQQLKVYGANSALLNTFPVSTGRFAFEFPPFGKEPACTDTPTGEFNPIVTKELHRSGRWQHELKDANGKTVLDPSGVPVMEGSAMGYSVFITPAIATHVAPPGTEGQLGTTASGGCIRMSESDAKTLFDYVVQKDASGQYIKKDPTNSRACRPDASNVFTFKAANYCADPKQWEVARKPLNIKVIVKDSSPIEEQRCRQMNCSVKKAQFDFDKKICVRERLQAHITPAQRATLTEDFNPRPLMEALPEKDRTAINEGCNSELKARYEAHPIKVNCNAPIPMARPANRTNPGALVQNVPAQPLQAPPVAVQPTAQVQQTVQPENTGSLDGLYMDFNNRN